MSDAEFAADADAPTGSLSLQDLGEGSVERGESAYANGVSDSRSGNPGATRFRTPQAAGTHDKAGSASATSTGTRAGSSAGGEIATAGIAGLDDVGGRMKPLPAVALTAAEQLTFEYRDPWDLAYSATELRARNSPRMCRRWKYPGETVVEAHLWKLMATASALLIAGALWSLYGRTTQAAALTVQLVVAAAGFGVLLALLVQTSRGCAVLLKYDGGSGLRFKSVICFLLASASTAAILAQFDQQGFYGAIAVGIIVSGVSLLVLLRLEPLEAILATVVCALTFGGGMAVISHVAMVASFAVQALGVQYIPPATRPGL